MKRSFINQKIREAIEFCNSHDFHLPKWAYWNAEQWTKAGWEADEIRSCGLGWDVKEVNDFYDNKISLLLS